MTLFLTYFVLFVFGLIIGSFLNVVIYRFEESQSLTGRSRCRQCRNVLSAIELIPVLSYVMQRGRCRSCGSPFSIQYAGVEIATGAVFALIGYSLGFNNLAALSFAAVIPYLFHVLVWSALIVIAVYDFKTTYIPDVFAAIVSVAALGLSLFSLIWSGDSTSRDFLLVIFSGPIVALPLFLLWAVSGGRWIGLGDSKLALGIGWYLGITGGISAVMFAFWSGAIVGVGLIALSKYRLRREGKRFWQRLPFFSKKQITIKSEVPFGPFLVLGTALVFFLEWNIVAMLF